MTRPGADADQERMLAVLRRLLVEPGWRRLYPSSAAQGLFPSQSAASRRLVEQLIERGLIEAARPEARSAEARITAAGREWLLEQENPRLLLEDLLRATESQCERAERIEAEWRRQRELLEQQCADVREVLRRLPAARNCVSAAIRQSLRSHLSSTAAADCTLAELYDQVRRLRPTVTVGEFHDAVRAMHEDGTLRLTPWTGPLYQLREPGLALLIGHEVLYYVQLARRDAA